MRDIAGDSAVQSWHREWTVHGTTTHSHKLTHQTWMHCAKAFGFCGGEGEAGSACSRVYARRHQHERCFIWIQMYTHTHTLVSERRVCSPTTTRISLMKFLLNLTHTHSVENCAHSHKQTHTRCGRVNETASRRRWRRWRRWRWCMDIKLLQHRKDVTFSKLKGVCFNLSVQQANAECFCGIQIVGAAFRWGRGESTEIKTIAKSVSLI